MKKLSFVTLVLLISVGWAVAQNPSTPPMSEQPGAQSPTSPGSQNPANPSATPGAPGQQQPGMPGETPQQPGIPGAQTGQTGQETAPAASGSTVEGCLGGSAGNFTISDKSGTTYHLQIPAGADTSKLNQHIGEEVRVTGAVSNSGAGPDTTSASSASGSSSSPAAATSGAAGSTGGPSIAVTKIDKISDKCSTDTSKPESKP